MKRQQRKVAAGVRNGDRTREAKLWGRPPHTSPHLLGYWLSYLLLNSMQPADMVVDQEAHFYASSSGLLGHQPLCTLVHCFPFGCRTLIPRSCCTELWEHGRLVCVRGLGEEVPEWPQTQPLWLQASEGACDYELCSTMTAGWTELSVGPCWFCLTLPVMIGSEANHLGNCPTLMG